MNKIFKALLLTIFISLASCDKETNELSLIENQTKSPFVIKIIGKEEVNSNPYLKKELEKFKQKTSNTLSKDVYNSEYHFIVDTDNVKYVKAEDGSIHSYTFSINAIEGSNLVENLVITSQSDGSYKTEILAYKFLDNNKLEINSVELDNFDTSDYLSRYSFSYTCTTTVTFTTTFDDNCTCEYVKIHNVDTNCNYTYIDTGNGGGGGGGSAWDDGVWYSGGGGSSNSNSNSNTTTQTVTSPNIHLGNWLLETLGIGNLGATGDELTIFNWINNNYSPTQVLNGSNPFFDVYTFYIENSSVTNINDIVKEIILIMDANPSLTVEEALLQAGYVNIESNQEKKIIPAEELKCFDLTKEAKLTVYIQQPNENSEDVMGSNSVGHAFIGIEQDGIKRQLGYYPKTGANRFLVGVGTNYDAEIRSNYNYLYHVSISQNITDQQLDTIVNYIKNFPSTYNVNNYACTDFAITVGNLGGMQLPSTTVNDFPFSGRSPGKLGQQVRAMNSTSTTL